MRTPHHQPGSELAREIDADEIAALDRAGEPDLPAGLRTRAAKAAALVIPAPPVRTAIRIAPPSGAARPVAARPVAQPAKSPPPSIAAGSDTAVVPRKGRGAVTSPPNRFEAQAPAVFDDGWGTLAADFADLPPLPTSLLRDSTRSVIAYN